MNRVTVPQLRIKCFGAPQIICAEAQIAPPLGGQAAALFFYLAVTASQGQLSHSRDRLADLFWHDTSNQQARTNLRYILPQLRKALGDYLLITPQTIAFDCSQPYFLDVEQFRTLLATAPETVPTAALQTAVDLYQDDFLASFRVRNAPVFEEWVALQQEALHKLAIQGLQKLAERYYTADNYRQGLIATQRLIALEPWHEAGHCLQMKLLALDGQRHAAVTQYQRLQYVLAEELGIEPELATTILYEQIRNGEYDKMTNDKMTNGKMTNGKMTEDRITLPPLHTLTHAVTQSPNHPTTQSPNHNLPGQLTPFFGRAAEIDQLCTLLADPEHRLITLTGMGGVGKTRLALAVGQATMVSRVAGGESVTVALSPIRHSPTTTGHFPDGVWFVPLSGMTTGPDLSEQLAVAIAQAMNAPFSDTSTLTTQVLAYLQSKRALLILDNFEPFIEAGVDFILELLRQARAVKLLVTSRSILNLQAEYAWTVAGLPTPDSGQEDAIAIPDLLHYSSIALFVERVQRVQRSFQLDATNQRAVCQICHLLDGLPLGIELAAAQLRLYTCDKVGQILAANAMTVATHYRDVPTRHRSLAAVLEDSWRLLTSDEQTLLACLSIFAESFTLTAAGAIAAATPDIMQALYDKSLVQRHTSKRYSLHEFVRQFAAEKGRQWRAACINVTAAQHGHFYLTLLREQESILLGAAPQAAVQLLQQELLNVEHAWQWAVGQGEVALLAQSCQGFCEFCCYTYLLTKGNARFGDAIAMIEAQLSVPQLAPVVAALETALAALYCAQGHILMLQAQYKEVIQVAKQAVVLARKQHLAELDARGTYLWGAGLCELGEHELAEQQLLAALALARTTTRQDLVILALLRLLRLAEYRADYGVAQQYGAEALTLSRANQALMAECRTLTALSNIYQQLGDFQQAKTYLEAALVLGEQGNLHADKVSVLGNLGVVCDNLGNYAAAQRYYQAALPICRDSGNRQLEAQLLGNLGISADYVGDYKSALRCSQESLELWQQLGLSSHTPLVYINLGLHTNHLGEYQAAQAYGRKALTGSQQINNSHLQSYAWTVLGHAAVGLDALDEAKAAYDTALALAREVGLPLMTIEPLAGLVRVGLARTTLATVIRSYLDEILNFLAQNSVDGLEEPFRVYLTCYQGLQALGDPQAQEILQTARRLLQQRARQIDDDALRRSFLENVAANRAILQSAKRLSSVTFGIADGVWENRRTKYKRKLQARKDPL
ncbi:MAG: tetratricopeptide repeat protein [Caldilineaceae bacterium]